MPPNKGRTPPTGDPDRYISNNLRQSAWDALRAFQASLRSPGTNPSQSDALTAALIVAARHRDETLQALQDGAQ